MKKFFFISLLIMGAFLTSCSDDDDFLIAPPAVEKAYHQRYPHNPIKHWELEDGLFKAEFKNQYGMETESWFTLDGFWVRSESEVPNELLPLPVKEYVRNYYPYHWVDDAVWVETPHAEFYALELEAKGKPDVDLYISPDGNPLEYNPFDR